MSVALAITYHDPDGRLCGMIIRTLPFLISLFDGIALQASPNASQHALDLFQAAGALAQRDGTDDRDIDLKLGRIRASALRLGLSFPASHLLIIDGDRLLHWADHYPEDLSLAVAHIPQADFTVFGRTLRAFAGHPRAMRETETAVNHLFSQAAACPAIWDVMVGARGVSRRAVEAVLSGCPDEAISVDVSWPLTLMRSGFRVNYLESPGLEFETGDRHLAEIEALGGYQAWLDHLDRDPLRWAHRFRLAQLHCKAIARFKD